MGKKIENPLREGLSSKIFLLAYSEPITGYELGKIIYGQDKFPSTSKIYPKLKELKEENHIIEEGDLNRSNPESLLIEFINQFEQQRIQQLSDLERHVLRKIISSRIFRSYIGSSIDKQQISQGDIDSVQFITSKFCLVTSSGFLLKQRTPDKEKLEPVDITQFDVFFKKKEQEAGKIPIEEVKRIKKVSKRVTKKRTQGLVLPIDSEVESNVTLQLLQLITLLQSAPTSLLDKIMKLDPMTIAYVALAQGSHNSYDEIMKEISDGEDPI